MLTQLQEISAQIGQDSALIQGAGGNTSIKCGDTMWVKASGCWLADAQRKSIFVSLRLSAILNGLDEGGAALAVDAQLPGQLNPELRPSIEATLHAVMPHLAVIHAHSVNATTVALLADGRALFYAALGCDIVGCYLPYATPGLPLAGAVRVVVGMPDPPDVILLQNHGIIVGAQSPAAAARLLRMVEQRLTLPVRALLSPTHATPLQSAAGRYDWVSDSYGIANDSWLTDLLANSIFTPDQAVFLGGGICTVDNNSNIEIAAERVGRESGALPRVIIQKGIGIFQLRNASAGTKAVIAWLIDIAKRIPRGAETLSLPAEEVAKLMCWDAEQYRLALDRASAVR